MLNPHFLISSRTSGSELIGITIPRTIGLQLKALYFATLLASVRSVPTSLFHVGVRAPQITGLPLREPRLSPGYHTRI